MANLKNIDENVSFYIRIGAITERGNNENETWLDVELRISSKTINLTIGQENGLMFNLYETKDLLSCLQSLLDSSHSGEKNKIVFCNIESNFEIKMEFLPEDEAVEAEPVLEEAPVEEEPATEPAIEEEPVLEDEPAPAEEPQE